MNVHRTILLVLFLAAFLGTTNAQLVNGRFSTSVYVWPQFDTASASRTFARAFQTLQLDVSQGDVSFQTSMYGATNISQSFGNDGLIRVNNIFLRWKSIGHVVDLNMGRIPVFAGVGNGTVDGALIKAKSLDERLIVTAYGGANVLPDLMSTGFGDLDKKLLVGSQVITTLIPRARIGVSYVNRHIDRNSYVTVRPDSLFNPVDVLIVPHAHAQQVLGIDARYDAESYYSLYGRYDYDLNSKHSLRGQFYARMQAADAIALTGEFTYREPFVPFNSFFTAFPLSPIREIEGGVEYSFCSSYRGFGRFAYVRYVDAVDRRMTIGLNADLGSLSYSWNSGYAGLLSSFNVQGMYPLFNRRFIPTAGFSYVSYRLSEDATRRDNIFAGSLGAIVRPMPVLSADVQLQWLHNNIASSDVRLFAKLNYWFSHNFNFFQHTEVNER